jgi:capsular exopolysaccharide synthesis family protein
MQQQEPDPPLIDLRELLDVVRRGHWLITFVAVLLTILAVASIFLRSPVYTSRAEVEVQPLSTDALQAVSASGFVNMDTEAARVTQEPVAALAAPAFGLNAASPSDLAEAAANVTVSVPANTTFLEISCTEPHPRTAQTCASAFANAYIRYRVDGAKRAYNDAAQAAYAKIRQANRRIEQLQRDKDTAPPRIRPAIQVQIDEQNGLIAAAETKALSLPTASPTAAVLSRTAELPSAPSNKPYLLAGALAALLGVVLGFGLTYVRQRLDERITGRDQLEHALGAPVLAVVPEILTWLDREESTLVTLNEPDSQASEAYKTARTNLLFLARDSGAQVIAVAGPGRGDGKTTTTGNLAVALAQTARRVVAVSCDLREPRLHRFFHLGTVLGLTSVLVGDFKLREVMQETEVPGLCVVPCGPVPENPAELLGSDDMERILDELRGSFDFVLLDTPPALAVTDTIAVAPMADGVVVVSDAAQTPLAAVIHVRHQLERVGCRILGGILNNLDARFAGRYSSYQGSYYAGMSRHQQPRDETGDDPTSEDPAVAILGGLEHDHPSKGARPPGGTRYSADFKDEAVRTYRESGKSLREFAEGLGVAPETLRRWASRIDIDAPRREGSATEEPREEPAGP